MRRVRSIRRPWHTGAELCKLGLALGCESRGGFCNPAWQRARLARPAPYSESQSLSLNSSNLPESLRVRLTPLTGLALRLRAARANLIRARARGGRPGVHFWGYRGDGGGAKSANCLGLPKGDGFVPRFVPLADLSFRDQPLSAPDFPHDPQPISPLAMPQLVV